MRLQRALHIISAVILFGLAALCGVGAAAAWRAAHAGLAGAQVLPLLRYLGTVGLPLLALSVLYVRPSRTGRWVSLVLLAALTIQFAPTSVRSAMSASRYATMARAPASAGPGHAGPRGLSPQDARFFQRVYTTEALVFGGVALWFAAQLALVSLSRRYWERIPDEPRPAAGAPSLPPPPS